MVADRGRVRDLTSEGLGVVEREDGPVVLLPYVITGEEVRYVVERRKRQVWYGRLIAVHEASPHRVAPQCSVFGVCGGCRWQMMSYAHQLEVKRRFVEEQLRHIGKVFVVVPPVHASPSPWHYRNKVEYAFGWGADGKIVVGFHPRGDFERVVGVEVCQIVPPAFEAVRHAVEAQAQQLGLPPYDVRRHEGVWRELLIRGTQEQCVVLVSLSQDRPEWAEALLAPLQKLPGVQGAGYFHNPKRNNSLSDLAAQRLWGSLELVYTVGGRQFEIGPQDFFQVNLSLAEALVAWLRARVPEAPVLYDLYGGVGFLGISLAERANKVVLIEKLPSAVEQARKNFARNQHFYPGTSFEGLVGPLEKVWPGIAVPSESVGIVDPPREGLHPSLLKLLRQGPFAHLFYVSCHPATQARDIAALAEVYDVREVQPFDMFPQTAGIENVAWLIRKG
jgi:23S rRNA (uracil1939-C5)-methyltransferase